MYILSDAHIYVILIFSLVCVFFICLHVNAHDHDFLSGENDDRFFYDSMHAWRKDSESFNNMTKPQSSPAPSTQKVCFRRRTPAPLSSPSPASLCTDLSIKNPSAPILTSSPNTHGSYTIVQDTSDLMKTSAYDDRAWPPIDYKNDMTSLPRRLSPPFPVVALMNYTRVRVDNRPLKSPLPIPEFGDKTPLPDSIMVEDNKVNKLYTRVSVHGALQMVISPYAPYGDFLGADGVVGDMDLQLFIMVKRKDIISDSVAVARIGEGFRGVAEWLQDTMYAISSQHMRYTRVHLAVFGVQSLQGSYYDNGKEITFDLQRMCRKENEQMIISRMCDHVASVYNWDRSYARQKLIFMIDEPSSTACTDFAGYAETGCKHMCYALMGNAVRWIPEANRFENERLAHCTIVHELLHGFALAHANILDVDFRKEFRDTNTTIMGDCNKVPYLQLNPMNEYKLGWLNRREFVDLDTLDRNGTIVTVPDASNACVVLAATTIIAKPGSFSGFVPYPVLTLAVRSTSIYEPNKHVCVMHTHGPVPPRSGNDFGISFRSMPAVVTYKIPEELGTANNDAIIDLFHPVLGSFLPPYLILQGPRPDNIGLAQLLQGLNIPSNNVRPNMRIRVRAEGIYKGHGDMQVRISKLM